MIYVETGKRRNQSEELEHVGDELDDSVVEVLEKEKRGNGYLAEVGREVLLDVGAEIGLGATDPNEGDERFEEVVDEVGIGHDVGDVGEEIDESVENGGAVGEDLQWRRRERKETRSLRKRTMRRKSRIA